MSRIYGWPERHAYPLDHAWQVHAAIAHFDVWRDTYPAAVREEIRRRIAERAARFGIQTPSLKGGDLMAERRRRREPERQKADRKRPRKKTVPAALKRHQFKKGHRPWNKGR